MSSMTKDQLREALVSHGVDPPPLNARKAEYIALYRAEISDLGLFSSDDEDEDDPDDAAMVKPETRKKGSTSTSSKSAQKTSASRSSTLIVDGENLADLTDDQLFRRLKDNGIQAGPINPRESSTSAKLADVMSGARAMWLRWWPSMAKVLRSSRASPKKKKNKVPNGLDQFSADEETADEQQPEVLITKSRPTSAKKLTPTSLRQRVKESTRKFYLRKLADVMSGARGDVAEVVAVNGQSPSRSSRASPKKKKNKVPNGLDQFSADEETAADEQQPEVLITKSRPTSAKKLTPTSLRQRVKDTMDETRDRFTPTPRRSIHSYKEHGDKLNKVYLQLTRAKPQEALMDRPSGEGGVPREPLDEQPSIGNV
ncbi:hypothetical protein TCAL_08259 [Tigriopus californicus]|uniref:LEM-like domain-containing protein n=1 Tax=Tigriopus californicus TaxID=6832 RepID=A0A553NY10_TIGCA|nr:hypothetical protein TCAL_08259 [Tigriopus californicus]